MKLPLLTSSAMSVARSCLRQYRNRYVLGLIAIRAFFADAPELGTVVHAGLETWWNLIAAGNAEEQLRCTISVVREMVREMKLDAFLLARAEALLIGYHCVYADDAAQYEVLATEIEFEAPLVNPATNAESKTFKIAGKLDGVIRRIARKLVLEHKTSGEDISQGSFYWQRRQMDGQVSIYFDGARALGHDVEGCLYDVLGKPDLRPSAVPLVDEANVKIVHDANGQRVRTKDGKKWRETSDTAQGYVLQTRQETPAEFRQRLLDAITGDPDRYYQRAEVARLEEDLVDAARDRWQLALILRDAMRTGTWPRNPDACLRFGHPCEYLEACSGRASLDDPYLFRRRESAHPELAGPASMPKEEAL